MPTLLDLVSSNVANCAYLIDVGLCTWIHNPIVLSIFILAGAILLLAMLVAAASIDTLSHVAFHDYFFDLVHNAINLIFIVRFPSSSSRGLAIVSSTAMEWLLLIAQNLGCMVLVFSSEYSLLYYNLHSVLKAFMWWQIVCPYLILVLLLAEKWWCRRSLSEKAPLKLQKLLTGSLLVDTNNNFLPIFMAHSFAAINVNFPFVSAPYVDIVYKMACISFKFYLINRYVLYEIVMVISDVSNLKSYAELYTPVQIGKEKSSRWSFFSRHVNLILICCTVVLMIIDGGFMVMSVRG